MHELSALQRVELRRRHRARLPALPNTSSIGVYIVFFDGVHLVVFFEKATKNQAASSFVRGAHATETSRDTVSSHLYHVAHEDRRRHPWVGTRRSSVHPRCQPPQETHYYVASEEPNGLPYRRSTLAATQRLIPEPPQRTPSTLPPLSSVVRVLVRVVARD